MPADFGLPATVLAHGWYQLAPFRWDGSAAALHQVEALPDGAIHRLRIRQSGGRGRPLAVEVSPPPSGPAARRLLRERIDRALNRSVDISEFLELCRRSPRLRYVPRTGAGRFLRCATLYEDVFKGICGTNIGWLQAVRAVNRVVGAGGNSSDGEAGAPPFPSPDRILRRGRSGLDRVSRLGYRVEYLLGWARRVADGDPDYLRADRGDMDRKELERYLLGIRGVGRSTAHYLMMIRGLGGEVPVDSSVYQYCRINRFGGRPPSEKEIRELYEPYGAWKGCAYWFEFLPWARRHWGLGRPRPTTGPGGREASARGKHRTRATRRAFPPP